jgi:hypothetical protein
MVGKILIVGLLSLVALPSCMHPVDQVLHAQLELKQSKMEATGRISQGACDDIGQYIAQNTVSDRLTLQPTETASALLMVR